jgi:hypothetical protein
MRSAEEILATLDDRGCLDALPFMPEMLQYCGKRFRVFKSAHKTCDTIKDYTNRRMMDAVHLEGLRCDGGAHDGCQAGCLIFWKQAWLKPVRGAEERDNLLSGPASRASATTGGRGVRCDLGALSAATRTLVVGAEKTEERYACQATDLLRATTPVRWWDPRQYMMDLASGNVRLRNLIRYMAIAAFNFAMRRHWRARWYPQYPSISPDPNITRA